MYTAVLIETISIDILNMMKYPNYWVKSSPIGQNSGRLNPIGWALIR